MAVSQKLNKKMSKTLKNKWIKALESDNYEQCTGRLQDQNGANCCLGVLCRVMRIKHDNIVGGSLGGIKLDKVIPQKLEAKLVDLNDNKKKSFDEIAAFLRKNKDI